MKMENHRKLPAESTESPVPGTLLFREMVGQERTLVQLDLLSMGRDFVLLVHGGEVHAGAAALASPSHEELAVIPPHKEGPLALRCARRVARASGAHCAVVAGIHQNKVTPEEIAAIMRHVDLALDRLLARAFPSFNPTEHDGVQP
jgi:hypothetical protein|nr:hypothetical protein [Candidatus Krumholzibacteria bacterium]